jgi:hypothetical protein
MREQLAGGLVNSGGPDQHLRVGDLKAGSESVLVPARSAGSRMPLASAPRGVQLGLR